MERRGETRICFLKITPDPLAHSYMVGSNILSLLRHMEAGAGKALISPATKDEHAGDTYVHES
jgi:hypothetical protein